MFEKSIEEVAQFTSPIHTIERLVGSTAVRGGAGTMFFVNENGVAVTCKHVAQLIPYSDELVRKYNEFKTKKSQLPTGSQHKKQLKDLMQQYGFDKNPLCQLLIRLNCAEGFDAVQVILHPKYDLAIVKMINPRNLLYRSYAKFMKSGAEVPQGKFLCRLGFPFPEFRNFGYDETNDQIHWTTSGNTATPRFPIEGMVTRHLADESGIFGIEMSTPGLKGQSGGPLFDAQGMVYGMQFATNHLHLGFDMLNQDIISNGEKVRISHYQPFLHVGLCVHAQIIKAFLRENDIKFYESA